MKISSIELSRNLNIKTNYMFKLFRSFGLRKLSHYDKNHLLFMLNCLSSLRFQRYEYKIMILKLNDLIDSMGVEHESIK